MIYIGNFIYLSNQEIEAESDRRHGEFNLIVEADDFQNAVTMFKERIMELKETTGFFEGRSSIFFNQLLEFDRFSRHRAVLLNVKSVAGDPIMPFIGCTLPSEMTDDCRIFQWEEESPKIDGVKEAPFLVFRE